MFGVCLSLTNGISHDEGHENNNWLINLSAIKNILSNGSDEILSNYNEKFHGVAFHFINQPIQYLIKDIVTEINNSSELGGILLSSHLAVFLIFCISGFFFYLIILKITKNSNYSFISTIFFLLYPYLFGHSQFNPKDIPFLSFWIINTFLFLNILENFYNKNKLFYRDLILLSFLTAFLMSIRILGIVIFIQYIISILILIEKKNYKFVYIFKNNFTKIFLFFFSLLIFIYILNPVFWLDPLEIINSIKHMSKIPHNVCTLTNGSCMYSNNILPSYYFIWLLYKLPLLVIISYLAYPIVESKIFKDDLRSIYYGTITIFVPVIIIIFILIDINIYDELRHIMFIIPLIFITSFSNLFYLIKIKYSYFIIFIFLIFFSIENYLLNPYQYTWLNSLSKFKNIEKNFEVDYWGLSNKRLQKKIINYVNVNNINKNICILGDMYVKEFLINENFKCFRTYSHIDNEDRPFIAYKNVRNVKRRDPVNCKKIEEESYRYLFLKKKISVGTIWYCD